MTREEALKEMDLYESRGIESFAKMKEWLTALRPPQPSEPVKALPKVVAWLPSDDLGNPQAHIAFTEVNDDGEIHVCIDVDDWLKTRGYSKPASEPTEAERKEALTDKAIDKLVAFVTAPDARQKCDAGFFVCLTCGKTVNRADAGMHPCYIVAKAAEHLANYLDEGYVNRKDATDIADKASEYFQSAITAATAELTAENERLEKDIMEELERRDAYQDSVANLCLHTGGNGDYGIGEELDDDVPMKCRSIQDRFGELQAKVEQLEGKLIRAVNELSEVQVYAEGRVRAERRQIELESQLTALQSQEANRLAGLESMKANCVDKCGHAAELVIYFEDGSRHCAECEAMKWWAVEAARETTNPAWGRRGWTMCHICDECGTTWGTDSKHKHGKLPLEPDSDECPRCKLTALQSQLADAERIISDCHHDLAANSDELKAAKEQLAETTDGSPLWQRTIDQFMLDGLVAIAGAVCTPEKGYKEDGGLQQFLRDVKDLRKQHDQLQSQLAGRELPLPDSEGWWWEWNPAGEWLEPQRVTFVGGKYWIETPSQDYECQSGRWVKALPPAAEARRIVEGGK